MDFYDILLAKKLSGGGGGSSVDVEALSVTANGTYTAEEGKAYSPVTVNVPTEQDLSNLKPVAYVDYDGTLVYNYTKEEFLAMSEHPSNPTHSGLVAEGWNWSFSDAQAFVREYGCVCIGQNYKTDDGSTRIYMTITDGILGYEQYLDFNIDSGGFIVDWGDGTTSAQTTTGRKRVRHTYANKGNYIVKITPDSNTSKFRLGYNGSNIGAFYEGNLTNQSAISSLAVRKLEVGESCVCFNRQCFSTCTNIESISIPRSVVDYGDGSNGSVFSGIGEMKGIVIPPNATLAGSGATQNFPTLRFISLPSTDVRNIASLAGVLMVSANVAGASGTVSGNRRIKYFGLGGTYTTSVADACRGGALVRYVVIPATVTTINDYAYTDTPAEFHLRPTSVPTLSNTRAFNNAEAIYVPYSADHSILDAYKTASNWSSLASKIYEES